MSERITKNTVEKIRKLDLLSYLKNYDPDELVRNGRGDSYYLRSHDSLKLSNGKWYQWSTRIGGTSALDYLVKVENWDFKSAVNYLKNLTKDHPPVIEVIPKRVNIHFRVPEKNKTNDDVYHYLTSVRKLNDCIVNALMNVGLIYQEAHTKNVVFIGRDSQYIPKFACKRGINSSFKQDCLGSNKEYSFNISTDKNTELHVFESAIDLISYMSILEHNGLEYYEINYLSLSGVGTGENYIPISLYGFLENHPNTEKIIFHLDNDDVGRSATINIMNSCKNQYDVYDDPPHYGKDVNDELIHMIEEDENEIQS